MKSYRFPCGCEFPILEESSDPEVMPLLDFDIEAIPETCPATWELLGRGDTKGVFQLESNLGRQWTKRLKPESCEHMGALGALLRPGPLKGVDEEGVSMTEHYVRRKTGVEEVECLDPALEPILRNTYGVLVFQEQLMFAARDLAGFDLIGMDKLRKAVGKKDQKALAKVRDEFLAGAKTKGVVSEEKAQAIWNIIHAAGRYSFNRAHADSYGIRGYKTAYVKAHFPLAFFAAWLRNARYKSDPSQEVSELVNDARLFDIVVEPPDLRSLEAQVHTDRKVVKFGLANIKGVGETQVEKLQKAVPAIEQEVGRALPGWSWYDFLVFAAPRMTSTVVTKFIQAGAMSYLRVPRQLMLAEYEAWEELTSKEQEWIRAHGPSHFVSLTEALEALSRPRYRKPKRRSDPEPTGPFGGCHTEKREEVVRSLASLLRKPPTPHLDTPHWVAWQEEELLGISLTCSRIDSCDTSDVNCSCKEFRSGRTGYLVLGVSIEQVTQTKTKSGKNPGSRMARLIVSDGTCSVEAVVFPDVWREFGHLLAEGSEVIMHGERDRKGEYDSFIVKTVWQASRSKSAN